MKYHVGRDPYKAEAWRVEAEDASGQVFVAVFSGPEAEDRARKYAQWMNS